MGDDLEKFASSVRISALKMTSLGGSSHIASVFSIADILAVLYGYFLKYNPDDPGWDSRDRFILSKGHAGAGVYASLANAGFIDLSLLDSHYQNGSRLSGHVSHKGIPGVEFSTGSLGHGLPVATGMAMAAKINDSSHRVVCLMSDGECDEGSNWEAFLLAAHHDLDNLIAVVDFNGLQSIKSTTETLNLYPFVEKLEAFGWAVFDVDGHSYDELITALESSSMGKPKCIVARTVKGKGVSFMENNVLWHYRTAREQEFDMALEELTKL